MANDSRFLAHQKTNVVALLKKTACAVIHAKGSVKQAPLTGPDLRALAGHYRAVFDALGWEWNTAA